MILFGFNPPGAVTTSAMPMGSPKRYAISVEASVIYKVTQVPSATIKTT